MCGILVFQDPELNRSELRKASSCLTHRGPDESGMYVNENHHVGLAHQRLSIIDVTGGAQPMTRGPSTVVYNGELYNYRELREELQQAGYDFETSCDTEVLVQAYNAWGTDCLERFRGMFSFCIFDEDREELFLARDRLGQKPLICGEIGDTFLAGSEFQALLQHPEVSRHINRDALPLYLQLKYVPSPVSMFDDLQKLEPAHYMTVRDGEIKTYDSYWSPSFRPKKETSLEESKSRVRQTLRESVRLRMRSDVPLGAFLSGGIDSSIAVALMAQESDRPIRTFSVGFDQEEYNELSYARRIAERYQTDHTELIAQPDVQELLPELARHYGEPFADASAVPTYYVAHETSKYVKVAMTGDGGDELFGGYGKYEGMMLHQQLSRWMPDALLTIGRNVGRALPRAGKDAHVFNKARRFSRGFTKSHAHRQLSFISHFFCEEVNELLTFDVNGDRTKEYMSSFYKRFEGARSWPERTMLVDLLTHLSEQLNVKVDIASMMSSIECRSPFLDHTLVDLVTTLPVEQRFRWGDKKRLLKSAFANDLPDEVLRHKKQGFAIPRAKWLRGELRNFTRKRLLHGSRAFRHLVDETVVNRLLRQHQDYGKDWSKRLWTLLMLELWMQEYDVTI